MSLYPRRSILYVPGSNQRALEKARTLSADGLILDLEDAVAPDAKLLAREQVGKALTQGNFKAREVIVRVNPLASPWGNADLEMAASCGCQILLVPKISSPEDIYAFEQEIKRRPNLAQTSLWAMIETARGFLHIASIAALGADPSSRLKVFVLGLNDLTREIRLPLNTGRAPLQAWISQVVLAARAYGLDIIDGVFTDVANQQGFIDECLQGRAYGLDGKTLIHPSQLADANEIFRPSAEEIAAAKRIIAAFEVPENQGRGVLVVDGQMVEHLHIDIARRILEMATAIDQNLD